MIHILIVDDEKIEREGLKYLLSMDRGTKRKVFEASNGKQALQITPHRRDYSCFLRT